MNFSPDRRRALGTAVAAFATLLPGRGHAAALPAALAALESRSGGRLGVALLDTGSGDCTGHRLDERFGLCSTFKLPLAGLVLRAIDQGRLQAGQWVPYGPADLLGHAPATRAEVGRGGMTVAALAQAAQITSDNTAANLLLGLIGGPAGFTAQLREMGDAVTRLDRLEPAMNLVGPGESRDTTTPAAMARTCARLLTGDLLSPAARAQLIDWTVATRTGAKRLRAGLPGHWRAGDKTGTAMAAGMVDKYNDVAIVWPPGRPALIVSAYFDAAKAHGQGMRDADQAVLAEVGRLAAATVR